MPHAARHVLASRPAAAGGPPAGYLAWYDASQITGQADNTALATWPDLSGNGNDMTQATPANRPTYYSSTPGKTVNGKPAVWFAPTTKLSNSTVFLAPQSIFFVAALTSLTDTECWYGTTAPNSGVAIRASAGTFMLLNAGVAAIAQSNAPLTLAPFSAGYTYANPGQASLYINSATPDSGSTSSATTIPTNHPSLGASGSGETDNGPICEMILYPTVLTGPQITAIYSYLKTKWGTP